MPARTAYVFLALGSSAGRRIVAGLALCVAVTACSLDNPRVPFDTPQMACEIADDLRRFEHVDGAFQEVEVLGWRIVESLQQRPEPLQPLRYRTFEAPIWVRIENGADDPGWLVVDAGAGTNGPWRRNIIYWEHRAPAPPPLPGEDASGTWHGFHRYAAPPTSEQVCDFARVAFLNQRYLGPDSRVVVAQLRRKTWRRLTGAEPACGVDESGRSLRPPGSNQGQAPVRPWSDPGLTLV